MFIKSFPRAWAKALKRRFHAVFGLKVKDLMRFGATSSKIHVESRMGTIEISMKKDYVSARWMRLKEDLIKEVDVQTRGSVLRLAFADQEVIKYITSSIDILSTVGETLRYVLYGMFKGMAEASEGVKVLLVDGKAGIERVLLTAYPGVTLTIREILAPDFGFIDSIYRLARDYMSGDVDLEAPFLRLFLEEELGFKPHIVEEFGIPRVYIET